MKWLALAAAWLFYGLAFCLVAGPGEKANENDDWIVPSPIHQSRSDDLLIRDILHGLDFNLYIDDLIAKPWDKPKNDSAYILKGMLP